MPPAKRDPHNSLTVLEEREKRARFSGVSRPRSIWLILDSYFKFLFLDAAFNSRRSFLSYALVPQGLSSGHTSHTFLPVRRCQESPQNVSSLSVDGEERGRGRLVEVRARMRAPFVGFVPPRLVLGCMHSVVVFIFSFVEALHT